MRRERPWYKTSGYKHLDVQIGEAFALKAAKPQFVAAHSWLPLIRYIKRIKRYKPNSGKTVFKERPIMFASHRDACILKWYAIKISDLLNEYYKSNGLDDAVIAYRKLGKANYDFSADAFRFVKRAMPCVVLCFDITGFFDNLDHRILKDRLKRILRIKELSADWFVVFRAVSQFRTIELSDLEKNPLFSSRLKDKDSKLIGTIEEIIEVGIPILNSPQKFGIPQGTPISSAFSNLYLLDFDTELAPLCAGHGGLYQRYSDDILIVCPLDKETEIVAAVEASLKRHKLKLATEKTDRQAFDPAHGGTFQYLGFNVSLDGAVIRPSSLARQWRKAKRAIRNAESAGLAAIAEGKTDRVFVSKLRRRFSPVGSRNFSSYARRADKAFGSRKISRQVTRLERRIDAEIRALQKHGSGAGTREE
jgi:RNA-directed DNA polymerase